MWQNNYRMISQYTLNNILLEFAISTSRPTAARLILQILAKYYSMYTSKSFNNCIMYILWGRASRHQKLAPDIPRDRQLPLIWWLNGIFSIWKCHYDWMGGPKMLLKVDCLPNADREAAVHTLDWSWREVDVKLMMMMMIHWNFFISLILESILFSVGAKPRPCYNRIHNDRVITRLQCILN